MPKVLAGTGQHAAEEYEYCFSDDCPNETCHAYAHGHSDGRNQMLQDLLASVNAAFERSRLGLNV